MNKVTPVDVELTRYVAEFIVNQRPEDLPQEVVDNGKKSILDGFGLALSGSVAKSGELVRQHLDDLGLAEGSATVIGGGRKVAPRFAAFANGVGIHADDYDDTQLAVAKDRVYGLLTHPTAPALPAAFAMAEVTDADGRDFMLAYHLGVEVECKIAEAIAPRHYQTGFHATATCGTFAAAAAASKLLGFDVPTTQRALSHGRQPVGRPAREFRHHDQAVPCRALLGKRRRRSAVRLLWLDRDRPHPGGAARLLQCCRRRLRPGGHLRQARRSVDIRQPRRVDQAASVGLADPPRHDRDAASHRGARHPRRGRGACARRHQFQHAERADPPPSQGRAAGQVLDGVLHGDPAPGAARRAERVHRRGGGARRRQGDDREGRLRGRRGGGSRRLPPDDDDHRHRPQGRAAASQAGPISARAARHSR